MKRRAWALAALATQLALAAGAAAQPAPLPDSGCPGAALVDPAFRDAALATLQRLSVSAPGQPADGALRTDLGPGHVDRAGQPWQRVSAYAANLGLVGALHADAAARPVAEGFLRWQARHAGPQGVAVDHWLQPQTLELSPCPRGLAPADCHAIDAHDSTAASLLLLADAWVRAGGDPALLKDPPQRRLLDAAALTLAALSRADGLTIAKPDHPVVYTMDQVEVIAGWRAWARVLRDVYAQPASADVALAQAARMAQSLRERLATPRGWRVSLDSGRPQPARWYADTVAQAWPLLWLDAQPQARADWQRAIAPWQARRGRHWADHPADADGFWWPSVAVAAWCSGDEAGAHRWVARARGAWMAGEPPFPWPFQVADLLWLLWLAPPAR